LDDLLPNLVSAFEDSSLKRSYKAAGHPFENEFQFSGSPTPRISDDVTFGHAHTLCSVMWLL